MSQDNQPRSPEEIENEIHETRERLDHTLHELEERFSPQQLMNTTYEYLRQGGANDIASTVGRTIKDNPLPIMVTGIGLGWLLISQRKSNQHDSGYTRSHIGDTGPLGNIGNHSSYASHLPVPADDMAVHSMEADGSTVTVTGAGTTTMGHDPASVGASATHSTATPSVGSDQKQGRLGAMTEKAQQMMGKAKGSAQQAGDRARHMGSQAGERAQHMGDNMRNKASQFRNSGGSGSSSGGVSQRARNAGNQTHQFIREHPLVAGALGIAVGAALGSLFPSTRYEDEYMGDMRDRTLDKARETGQEQAERAQAKVQEQAERAQEKIHEKAEQARSNADSSNSGGAKSGSANSSGSDKSTTGANATNEQHYAKAGSGSDSRTGTGTSSTGEVKNEASKKGGNTPESDNNYSSKPGNQNPTRGA